MRNLLTIALISLCSYSYAQGQLTSAQEVSSELASKREDHKKAIINEYLSIRNSLLVSDSIASVKQALKMVEVLKSFKFKKLHLQQMNEATTIRGELIILATELAATTNITTQRKIFSSFSTKFWDVAGRFKPMNMPLYQQVCPMTGDIWVSESKEIKNPYYPKNMLTCGEVKESL